MSDNRIERLRARAGAHALAHVEDNGTGLAFALVKRYLQTFEDSLDDYAASWNASRETPEGAVLPAWTDLTLDVQARYIGYELEQCAEVMIDRIADSETDIHDVMPEAWDTVKA